MASARSRLAWVMSVVLVVVVMSVLGSQPVESQLVTNPTDREVLREMMYAMSYEYDWDTYFPDPCVSSPQGILCEPDATTGVLYVTQLQFGFLSELANIIPCSANATIPASLASLTRLTTLSFTSCFTHTPGTTIPSLLPNTLRFLTFTSNPTLTGTIPGVITTLTSLERLILSQNALQGFIPSEIGSLHSLTQLDLSHNNLTGSIPASLGSIDALVNLDLRYNNLTGAFPVSISQGGRQLQRLAMSYNAISGALPDTFTGLGSLTFMDLSFNNLSGVLPPSIGSLRRVEDLFLNSNPFLAGSLPVELGGLSSLVRLDLSACAFAGAIPDAFHNLENLRFLSVSNNRLTGAIPGSLASLPVIFTMNLNGNRLSGPLPFPPNFVKRMGRNLLVDDNPGLCSTPQLVSIRSLRALNQCPDVITPPVVTTTTATSPTALSPSPNGCVSSRRKLATLVILLLSSCSWLMILLL